MKTILRENKHNFHIELIPETIMDVAILLRIGRNAKAEKPTIIIFFSDIDPNGVTGNITLRKKELVKQSNYINPKLK